MKALKFLVRYPDGRAEDFTIDAERVLIGSGAHCDIRLPVDQAAMEHVSVSMGPASAVAEARAFEPPPTINGSPFQRSQLLPDAILGIGQVQMTIAVVEIAEKQGLTPRKQEKTSPLTYILAAVAVPLSLYVIFSDSVRAAPTQRQRRCPRCGGIQSPAVRRAASRPLRWRRTNVCSPSGDANDAPFMCRTA